MILSSSSKNFRFAWFMLLLGLTAGTHFSDEKKSNEKRESRKSEEMMDENLLSGMVLPIPPKVTNTRMKRMDRLDEKFETLPKYTRLPVVDGVKVGYEREIEFLPGINRTVKTLSLIPKVFEIEDFLDEDECDLLIELAKRKQMRPHVDRGTNNIIQDGPEKTFYSWDLNDDGFIDKEELALVPAKTVHMSVEDADDMMFLLKMDSDKDGKIDLKEMIDIDLLKVKNYLDEEREKQEERREMRTENAWVWHDDDELLRFQNEYFNEYHTRFTSLTGIPEELFEESEPLLVQHYRKNQFSQCRRDSDESSELPCCLYGETTDCRNCRYLSMEIFLNDVEKGGDLVFPMANHEHSNIMNCSGEWRGYFTYAMTTGSQNRFTSNLEILQSGPNQLLSGEGRDASGDFEITDGIVLGNMVKFKKKYRNSLSSNGDINYSGKIIAGSRILGNWWVHGKKRLFGNFFMWNKDYEISLKLSQAKCNHEEFCTKSKLVVTPKKGKAVFWYNHERDYETGMLGNSDNDCLFGHCAVENGEKWVATARLNVIGDGEIDLRAWRRGINWLQNAEKYPNIMKKIGSHQSRTKVEEYKDDFERFKSEEIKVNKSDHKMHEKKTQSHVLNAVTILLNAVDSSGLNTIAKVVHKKLRLTCVPYYGEEAQR